MQELIYGPFLSLKQARAQGLKRYYTGKPCKNGHVAVRFVQGSQCVICKALWASKSQKRNKTAKNARQKRYREKHRDELRQSGRDRYASFSPERKAKYIRERNDYHLDNPDVAKRCYRKNPHLSYIHTVAYRARLNKVSVELTQGEAAMIKAIYAQMKRLNVEAGFAKYHVDHVIPVSKGGIHHPSNLQILTATENLKKGAKYKQNAA